MENGQIKMVIVMKEIGVREMQQATEKYLVRMEINTKGISRISISMEKEVKNFQTEIFMKGNISTASLMDLGSTSGQLEVYIVVSFVGVCVMGTGSGNEIVILRIVIVMKENI
jgi:hypothetical protein